ncbi:hypothetical protein [Streptomyces sp. H39-S7]|uniref:hypothetical protein n=1 Tax=Streptomyces sp. H39-S7 TaxID=3004357 RepID=UPI0022B02BDA|nr:hypothetical protein [Streptomyces sp. H39-S7]MCZ4125464.1 hypothetical protein [Streptomyces sp. H39-S7]
MGSWFSSEWEPTVTAAVETADGVTHVRILCADGELAACGQAGLTDSACVFDQIVTEPAHQRLGPGTVVMDTLTNAAIEIWARPSRAGGSMKRSAGRSSHH